MSFHWVLPHQARQTHREREVHDYQTTNVFTAALRGICQFSCKRAFRRAGLCASRVWETKKVMKGGKVTESCCNAIAKRK
jgi:hypothetical protein